tara:strand:+ start:40 stop:708 length:669 start_codon:yes stop_codon:yes gene_type:complete
MRKARSRTYLKALTSKAVKYYFENPDITIKSIAAKFRLNQTMLSAGISKQLEKRFDNSLARKYLSLILLFSFGLQLQAQINLCDSISYTTLPQQTLTVVGDQSGLSNIVDSTTWIISACNSLTCYAGSGQISTFINIMPTDTVKVCYDVYVYSANTTVCSNCDSLIYDNNSYSWIIYNTANTVGINEIQSPRINNNIYDLFGRQILKPKGIYIQNNKLFYKL